MKSDRICVAIVVLLLPGFATIGTAQQSSSQSSVENRWPDQPRTTQSVPWQSSPQPSAMQPMQQRPVSSNRYAGLPVSAANVIACGGVFGKDSTHLKLAMKYDSRNIVFGEVDGPDGSKINASILFPNDPKRRLEVLWNNEGSRSDMSLIAINGTSQWVAPKGLRVGLGIGALEKANGRPFKLSGFAADGSATVLGWEGGTLTTLPGGCKVGIRLVADAKASPAARSAASAEKEHMSNTPGVLALKPTIGEILIGY